MIERKNGIILPKNHPEYSSVVNVLGRTIYEFNNTSKYVKFYEEFKDYILIPRFYPLKDTIRDINSDGEDINIECNLVPRNDRQRKAIEFLTTRDSGILKLEPGSGKTCVSIAAISILKKKSIVFVHKDPLKKQWKEEVLKFTNLSEEDVAFLSTKTHKEDLKKPIIIATVQTVCSMIKNDNIDVAKEFETANVGIAFFDEAHTSTGPEKFSLASLNLPVKKVFGLSATPSRADGCDDIMQFHLGEIQYFEAEENELLKPKVFMIYFNFNIFSEHKKYCMWGGNFNTGKYYQQMYKSEKYISTVVTFIKKLYSQNRNLLILGIRKNALLTLAESCQLPKDQIGIFIPTSTEKERLSVSDTSDLKEAFDTKRLVFSTYNAARDGNNRESLDTLVMSCPTGNVEQAAGRVLRILDGKNIPFVIDLVDLDCPEIVDFSTKERVLYFVRTANKRLEFYNSKGWEVQKILIN